MHAATVQLQAQRIAESLQGIFAGVISAAIGKCDKSEDRTVLDDAAAASIQNKYGDIQTTADKFKKIAEANYDNFDAIGGPDAKIIKEIESGNLDKQAELFGKFS